MYETLGEAGKRLADIIKDAAQKQLRTGTRLSLSKNERAYLRNLLLERSIDLSSELTGEAITEEETTVETILGKLEEQE